MSTTAVETGMPVAPDGERVASEVSRANNRRELEKQRQHQRFSKVRSKKNEEADETGVPVCFISNEMSAGGDLKKSIDRSKGRRGTEQRLTNLRSPPRSVVMEDVEEELVFEERPTPTPYSRGLLLTQSELSAKPGSRADQILSLRRSGLAARDSFNNGLRSSKSVSQLRNELSLLSHGDLSASTFLAEKSSMVGSKKESSEFRPPHDKVQARVNTAPRTRKEMLKELGQGKYRKTPVVKPGLPYRGIRSASKFPSGFLHQNHTKRKHRMYLVQNENAAVQEYLQTTEKMGLSLSSVTGGPIQGGDKIAGLAGSIVIGGENKGGGGSGLSYAPSFVDSEIAEAVDFENISESKGVDLIPPSVPGERPRRKPQSLFSDSSNEDGRWGREDEDLLRQQENRSSSFLNSEVDVENVALGPFQFLYLDDAGHEATSRNVYERSSFCPGTPNGRRVYWEEKQSFPKLSNQLENLGSRTSQCLSQSSYKLPENTKKWGSGVETGRSVEAITIGAPSHDVLMVAPLSHPKVRESMSDPSFRMSQLSSVDNMPGVRPQSPDSSKHAKGEKVSSSRSMTFLTSIIDQKNATDGDIVSMKSERKALRLDSFRPSQPNFDIKGWDARSEGGGSRPVSRSESVVGRGTVGSRNQIVSSSGHHGNELHRLTSSRISEFQKLGMGSDLNIRVSNISGRQVTSTSGNFYVPKDTTLTVFVDFLVKEFSLNPALDWMVEYLPSNSRVWASLETNSEWTETLLRCMADQVRILPKFRIRRCPPRSPFIRAPSRAGESVSRSGSSLISTLGSLSGHDKRPRGLQEDMPSEMLHASPSLGDCERRREKLSIKNASLQEHIESELVAEEKYDTKVSLEPPLSASMSPQRLGSPQWDQESNPEGWGGWGDSMEPLNLGVKQSRMRTEQQDEAKKVTIETPAPLSKAPSFLRRQQLVSEGKRQMAYYMRSQKMLDSYKETVDRAGRKQMYIPTNVPVLEDEQFRRSTMNVEGGLSIMKMLDVAHSPTWDLSAAVSNRVRKRKHRARKLPSIEKMKEFHSLILKKYNAKAEKEGELDRRKKFRGSRDTVPQSGGNGAFDVPGSILRSSSTLTSSLSFRSLYSHGDRQARLMRAIPTLKDQEETKLERRKNNKRLFLTQDGE